MANQPKSGSGIKLNKDTPKIPFFMFVENFALLFAGK